MTHPTAQQPNNFYLDGLQSADTTAVEAIYSEFRRPIARAVELAGGSNSDGNTFFRVAVIHASLLADQNKLQEDWPAYFLLKNLAVAHFRDWAIEKGLDLPEPTEPAEDEAAYDIQLPDEPQRLEVRRFIRAKRQWTRLEQPCKNTIGELAHDASLHIEDPRLKNESTAACIDKYRQALNEPPENWVAPLPEWVVTALTDDQFGRIWATAETMEGRLALGPGTSQEPPNKTTRYILVGIGLLLLGYAAWSFFNKPKSAGEIYKENYAPPASIMADRIDRARRDSVELPPLPAQCEQLLEQADELYKQKAWEESAGMLAMMVGDETEECKSDALFYLGLIGLQMEQPDMTLDCLAKITDIERFGEDLYWYQALAFVQIAAQNPMRRSIARRAVERARSNTEIPERRAQAEKMLKQLED